MGISRKCVRTWLTRFAAEGETGLVDRSSRPHTSPTRTPVEVEDRIVELRRRERRGPAWLGAELGVPARTVSRVLLRRGQPRLCTLDPMTGQVIRASKQTATRYERSRPGELVHMDVKKLGRIPDGGGWRAHGRGGDSITRDRETKIGYDYVHSLVDDHSRLAYSEILPDEKGATCAAFLTRAAAYFAAHGIDRIERDDRQRLGLQELTPPGVRRDRGPTEVHQAALPLAERQGRTAQPHPGHRMGLMPGLHQQRRAHRRPCSPGSSTTTLDAATAPSADSLRSAAWHQPDDSVQLARDTAATIAEARALWWAVDRPNLFVKIPAARQGLPAISACLAEAISINVTPIFSLTRYTEVIDAFFAGLEGAARTGRNLARIASVASFFVSPVDTEADARLDKIGTPEAAALRGTAAIANARLAYQQYEIAFGSERWTGLRDAGARPQRPLWASTSTKDPAHPDTRYVVDLVAPGVVNTMPETTLRAVADQGIVPKDSVRDHYADSREILDRLAALGIDYDDVVSTLENDGVALFDAAWAGLAEQLARRIT